MNDFLEKARKAKALMESRFPEWRDDDNYMLKTLNKLIADYEISAFSIYQTDLGVAAMRTFDSDLHQDLKDAISDAASTYNMHLRKLRSKWVFEQRIKEDPTYAEGFK